MKTPIKAYVEQISPLTNSILQLKLKPVEYQDYLAGQYLKLCSPQGEMSYSIANAPLGSHTYEIHIRHTQDNGNVQTMLQCIKDQGFVFIQLPFGRCHVQNLFANKPILFIAAGTGFAPIHAMIEHLLAQGDTRSFELFWGAHSQSDLYMDDKLKRWETHVAHFRYKAFLSQGKKETLISHVLKMHQKDLLAWQIVIAGPFEMVFTVRDALALHGVAMDNMFSDAFDFAK